jgi:hypothetical protein
MPSNTLRIGGRYLCYRWVKPLAPVGGTTADGGYGRNAQPNPPESRISIRVLAGVPACSARRSRGAWIFR